MNSVLKELFPVIYHAWPDANVETRSALLGEWGWQIVGEHQAASRQEMIAWLLTSAQASEYGDGPWNQGCGQADGWQCLFSALGHFGALREIYTNFGFPVLEWVDGGTDQDFDLDILIGMPGLFFFAHVREGKLNTDIEPVRGQVAPERDVEHGNVLLSLDVPEASWPSLRGLPKRLTVFGSLRRTLASLNVPEIFWSTPPLPLTLSYVEVEDTPQRAGSS